jgi:hypothetical protein
MDMRMENNYVAEGDGRMTLRLLADFQRLVKDKRAE